MSILDSLFGSYGGSLTQAAKQGGKQMSILDMIGMGAPQSQYTAPIGPMQGTGTPMPSEQIPAQQQSYSGLGDLGRQLATWGAGVSKASGPSRLPVDFGQALAGGTDALNNQGKQDLENQKTQAEIGVLGTKQQPDFDKTAQQALIKMKMGLPLSPQEQASLEAWDTMNQTKSSATADPFGVLRMTPRASILPQGGAPQMNPSGSPAPDMQNLRGYYNYLQQKAGQ